MSKLIGIFMSSAGGQWVDSGYRVNRVSDLVSLWDDLAERNRNAVVLFWALDDVPLPDVAHVLRMLAEACAEVLHGGGTNEYASDMYALRYVQPAYLPFAWSSKPAYLSSPEISLQRCAVSPGVMARAAAPCDAFESLGGAQFALGWEWFRGGVVLRSAKEWRDPAGHRGQTTVKDQLFFVRRYFGATWCLYVALRLAAAGSAKAWAIAAALLASRKHRCSATEVVLRRIPLREADRAVSVAVLIPTIDRVPYLRSTLDHLRRQTHRPDKIVVVDQTPLESRDLSLEEDFKDLPLEVIRLEKAGQSSARNAGLARIQSDWTLLIDDDVDLPPTLIAQHLSLCEALGADASVGVAVEEGVPELPPALQGYRLSPVLNGNNSFVRTACIKAIGGFDLAYDGGSRADGDVGIRMHQSGALMILDGANSLFHHHAPRGGLRVHRARVETRATARMKIFGRHPVVPTELYLALRFFGEWSVRETRLIRLVSSLRMDGSRPAKAARLLVAVLRMRSEWRSQSAVEEKARRLLQVHPTLGVFVAQSSPDSA